MARDNGKTQTLEEQVRFAKAVIVSCKHTMDTYERRRDELTSQLREVQEQIDFLDRANESAPARMLHAEERLRRLQTLQVQQRHRGDRPASRGKIDRRRQRAEVLSAKLADVLRDLRDQGEDPEALVRLLRSQLENGHDSGADE